jgi:hypothetical protein
MERAARTHLLVVELKGRLSAPVLTVEPKRCSRRRSSTSVRLTRVDGCARPAAAGLTWTRKPAGRNRRLRPDHGQRGTRLSKFCRPPRRYLAVLKRWTHRRSVAPATSNHYSPCRSERSAARLAHQSGGLGVPSSNLGAPTRKTSLIQRLMSTRPVAAIGEIANKADKTAE